MSANDRKAAADPIAKGGRMRIIGLFSGAGGMDLGFSEAGFDVIWANEYDRAVWETYALNHPATRLDRRDIRGIPSSDIPDCDGVIGGPPCQSWSEAGALRGIDDDRGRLFFEFVRVLRDKRPLFFVAENVSGMLSKRHEGAVGEILRLFDEVGYGMSVKLLTASDYGVPQDRQRVFYVGFRKDLGRTFMFPGPTVGNRPTLRDAIWDIRDSAIPAMPKNRSNGGACLIPNHEYFTGSFSPIYMSRNRVRSWDEQSFTIQAGARHAPIHPSAPRMTPVGKDVMRFEEGSEGLYRRLTVRECARIQTFPDSFVFRYGNLSDGYKMVGNAVPVGLAREIGRSIRSQLEDRPPGGNRLT
ncbi:MAG: DNA cytosine methyltransferase [Methanomassiliicoccaceae archaeon]|nr:DNA cytosine methyltransferase [Methanomassiliicoccaceae archaeon]